LQREWSVNRQHFLYICTKAAYRRLKSYELRLVLYKLLVEPLSVKQQLADPCHLSRYLLLAAEFRRHHCILLFWQGEAFAEVRRQSGYMPAQEGAEGRYAP
jgi:hypothetical protein